MWLRYVLVVFAVSWGLAGAFWSLGGKWTGPAAMVAGVVYMFVPAAVALLMTRGEGRDQRRSLMGLPAHFSRWYLLAWLLPMLLSMLTLAVSLGLPGVALDLQMHGLFERFQDTLTANQIDEMRAQIEQLPVHPFVLGLLQALVAGFTINAVAAWGEEVGWRGLLHRELRALGFWRSAWAVGAIWGIWHAPIILMGHNYPEHPVTGVLMMTVFCVLTAPLIQGVRERAGSVLAAAVYHGGINATAGLAIMIVAGGSDLLIGVTGLAGLVVLLLANVVLWLLLRIWPDLVTQPDQSLSTPAR